MSALDKDMNAYTPARRRSRITPGESLRIVRKLQHLSQTDLAWTAGIPQPTISAIENGRIRLGAERAKVLARALQCHPAVLLFPGWKVS